MEKRVKVDWVSVIYRTDDQALINYFWWFYNHHRLSKQRAARSVLIHYYSTTAAPDFVIDALSLYSKIKTCKKARKATAEFYGV